ncbi:hypothetical protein Hanom_Chr03g00218261 [Helianthus anomalus]
MVELLEYYKIHISQLSPLGMLTEQLGFFSFRVREGAPKCMSPPKGITKWKTKFFYMKAVVVTTKLQFRNVRNPIVIEQLSTPVKGKQAWFSHLHVIASKKLENRQLWILRMMLGGKLGRKARPVLREKNEDGLAVEAPLWRTFFPDFEGKIEIVKCGRAGKDGMRPFLVTFGSLMKPH